MPFCVQRYRIKDGEGNLPAESGGNHQSRNRLLLESPVRTERLVLEVEHPRPNVPAAILAIAVYAGKPGEKPAS